MKVLYKFKEKKNSLAGGLYLVGNLFDKAIVFLTIPIFTRLLSPNDFGIVNTYLACVSILALVVGLSLGNSIRSAYVDFKEDLDGYISSIFFLSFINFFVVSSIILLFTYFFIETIDLILVVLCLIQSYMTFVINSITIKYMMLMNFIKRTLLLAIPNILIALLSVVFLFNIENDLYFGRIIPYILITSTIGTVYLVYYLSKIKKIINPRYWKYSLIFSVPMIFHGLSITVLSSSDRIMLTAYANATETGVYSLVYNLSMLAIVVTASLESVWIPWFTEKMKVGDKKSINYSVVIYIEVVTVMIITLMLLSPEILMIMSPPEYWYGKIIIPPIILSSYLIFLYSISVNLEYYYKKTRIIAINTMTAAFTNIALNFIFIPLYGLVAAAFTTVFSYLVSFLIHYLVSRKIDSDLFSFYLYIKPLGVVLFFMGLSYSLMDFPIIRWGVVIIGGGFYILYFFKQQKFLGILN